MSLSSKYQLTKNGRNRQKIRNEDRRIAMEGSTCGTEEQKPWRWESSNVQKESVKNCKIPTGRQTKSNCNQIPKDSNFYVPTDGFAFL